MSFEQEINYCPKCKLLYEATSHDQTCVICKSLLEFYGYKYYSNED